MGLATAKCSKLGEGLSARDVSLGEGLNVHSMPTGGRGYNAYKLGGGSGTT